MFWILFTIASALLAAGKRAGAFITGRMDRGAFIQTMGPIAKRIQDEYGIAPRITLLQSAHESGWGESKLATDSKNLFGMTADGWKQNFLALVAKKATPDELKEAAARQPFKEYETKEHSNFPPEKIKYWTFPGDIKTKTADGKGGTDLVVIRPFRVYADWYQSTRDWAAKLQLNPTYSLAYAAAKSGDTDRFAKEVAAAGYGSNPAYRQDLVALAKDPYIANA